MFNRRNYRAKGPRKKSKFHPYKSALEKKVAGRLGKEYEYEPTESKVKYSVPHVYSPDFVNPSMPSVIFEVKGYFRTSAEASKYVHIKANNPEVELVFIFSNVMKKAYPGCRPRKDGTVLTLAEWAKKNEFLYYQEAGLPDAILEGKVTKEWVAKQREAMGYVHT